MAVRDSGLRGKSPLEFIQLLPVGVHPVLHVFPELASRFRNWGAATPNGFQLKDLRARPVQAQAY